MRKSTLYIYRFLARSRKKAPVRRPGLDFIKSYRLLEDLGDDTGTDGTAALADSETQALLNSDGGDQLDVHNNVVAGHAHVSALGQRDDAGNVGGTEVELGTIVVEERSVTAAFFLGQDVDLASELGQGLDGAGLAQKIFK